MSVMAPGDEVRGARDLTYIWLAASVVGLTVGGILWLSGYHDAADTAWAVTTWIGLVPLTWTTILGLIRREAGVDLIALLAMAGSLALGEYLAGAVIALMLASGRALETYADRRAHRELSALLDRAPQMVTRYEGGELVVRPIGDVRPGDRLFVKTGEVVPVDGVLTTPGVFDESALTGESRPSERPDGDQIRSGAVNAGSAIELRAVATAAESTYAGIVRLVEEAEKQKAPSVRVADRYAVIFIPVTLVIAGAAWLFSGDPVRALSVLVVATPCPLILAVPIAVVAGISRAARRGIIVKGGERWRRSPAGRCCCSTRPARSRRGSRRSPTSRCSRTSRPKRCSAWPHRSTRSRRTCWRRRSSGRRAITGSPSSSRPTSWSGTARASRARWTAAASRSARRRSSRRGRPCLGAPARSADGRRSTVHRACSSRWTEPWPVRW